MLKKRFHNQFDTGSLEHRYNQKVRQGLIRFEPAQVIALQHLQSIFDDLIAAVRYQQQPLAYKLFHAQPKNCRSLYLYGEVGRGKSMLMDLFYQTCPIPQKRRVHFHAFMLETHDFIHQWRKRYKTDAIVAWATQISKNQLLLCFDEFHVTDIADAMILTRLFEQLFAMGTVIIMTSNCHPNVLYQGGLQRASFLPFIELLQQKADVVELVAKQDFRLNRQSSLKANYYYPLDQQAATFIQQRYAELTHFLPSEPVELEIFSRKLVLTAAHGSVLLTTFDELCLQPLGAADYLAIGSRFETVILSNIPKLNHEKCNEAKRFVTLIDALYECKVRLICSAEVPIRELYVDGEGSFEFRRTVSRLFAMQSETF